MSGASALGYRHARVQRLRRLFARRNAREREGCFVVEGAKALDVALSAGVAVESVYLDPAAGPTELALAGRALDAGARVFDLEPRVLARVAQTVTPQPVLAVVAMPAVDLATLASRGPNLVVVCVEVRDPGNAGAMVRAAEAAGADAVVFCEGAVDPFNPKTVRASAGALLLLPVVEGGPPETVLAELGRWGLWRWGTAAQGGRDYAAADLTRPAALVLGNEAHGLPAAAADQLDGTLTVPMCGSGESLNVGTAAAVLCFEAARQRRQRPSGAPPGLPPRGGSGMGAGSGQIREAVAEPSGVEIVSTISHELRSPLASVKGYTSLLLRRWELLNEDDKRMMLTQVNHDAGRVTRLIGELLDISRLESGGLTLRRAPVNLEELAVAVVAKVRVEYPELEPTLGFPADLPPVWADADKIEQVLTNLVENACKYASPLGLVIACEAGAQEVSLTVTDRGEGIPPSDLPRVFSKFFRRHEGKPTGSGLGLWISRGLVEAHGGELLATSNVGQGSSFRFTLPLTDVIDD